MIRPKPNLVRHYTVQLVRLRIQRMRIMSKPVVKITHFDLCELEEIDSTIHNYKERLHEAKIAQEEEYDDSRVFDL